MEPFQGSCQGPPRSDASPQYTASALIAGIRRFVASDGLIRGGYTCDSQVVGLQTLAYLKRNSGRSPGATILVCTVNLTDDSVPLTCGITKLDR